MSETHLALYLTRLLDTLQQELKDNLLAVYIFGSAGYNAYEPDTSDVDIYAVIHHELKSDDYNQLARRISHASIPCPARKLEFVLFTKSNAARQTSSPRFEMNFNTGREMERDYINLDASSEPGFWFVLDLAMGRELGTALLGPPASEVFAAPKKEWILDAMVESLDWHRQQPSLTPDAILNACRALRFAKSGTWGSKKAGGDWVIQYYGEHEAHVVSLALEARRLKGGMPQNQVAEFLDFVNAEIEQCRSAI
jgi:predicted nucleotidyltransferase